MKNKQLLFLIPALILSFILNLSLGSVNIPFSEVLDVIFGLSIENDGHQTILLNFRLPRAIAATLAGAALGLSGLYMQTFFRNPLAGPYVLGISSGSSMGVALVVLGFSGITGFLPGSFAGNWAIILSSILGATLVFSIVLIFAARVKDNTALLIIGLMFSSATSALVSILQYFSTPDNIQSYLIWTFGDLGSITIDEHKIFVPLVIVGIILSVLMVKPLNILLLGETYAKNAGLNIRQIRYAIIFLTALMAGTVTAFCGPIAFIGLAVPHLARMSSHSSDHRSIIPLTIMFGSLTLLICDIVSRLPGFTQALPLNAITSLFGAPLVIWLILKRKSLNANF